VIIVCDTNVLISAFLFPGGIPDKIIRAVFAKRLIHATSPDILTEFKRLLKDKFQLDEKKCASVLSLVQENSQLVYPTERLSVIIEDPPDNRILECAVTAKANFLITGDKKHLLPLKQYQEMMILAPRQFAEKISLL
jgi:uncharacterized protein